MLHLKALTEEEFTAYKAFSIENYAQDISENYGIPIDEAQVNAVKEFDRMLSQGLYQKMGYRLTGMNMEKWLTD